ncbi:MAG: GH32 C-terminal domain-containing protein [Anaerolineales bacterium]
MELFVNEQIYLVSRIYPTRSDSLGVGVFAEGQVKVPSLDMWEMKSIWE